MKRLMKPALLLTAVGALALAALTSVNADPTPKPRGEVTFNLVLQAPAGPEGTVEGCFVVEGAINDAGAATETFKIAADLSVSGYKVLEGRRGTIVMWFEAQLEPDLMSGAAEWKIIAGTGAYKKIRGSGEGRVWIGLSEDGTPYLGAEYSGPLLKDPSLK